MEPEDQRNIPTKHVIMPGSGEPSQGVSDSNAAALFGAGRSHASGGPWQPPSPEELQRDFPLYEIRGILGRGGMGAVYKGWQRSLDRLVAIKILPPGMDDSIGGFTERFKREARAMAQLQHPGIVTVFDAGTTSSGLLYFVMECITGTDVQQLVKERGRLDPAEALRITSAVCDALGYAHEHGVIHRDIKPSNIMLDGHGNVKVADFGLAKSTAPETTMLTGSNVTMGTPEFMAPESLKGVANVDHRVDLYAVGVMLYQMLTGDVPRGRFVPPSRAVPGLDKRLDAIVDKALQPEPAARYSTATELRTAIEPVTRSIAKRVAAVTRASASRKKPLFIGIAVAVLAAIAALVHFAPWKKDGGGAGAPRTLPASVAGETRDGARVPPSAATKENPFVNTLGMQFVPVPGTQALFNIWDTRVMDYGAYAKAQEAAGKKVDGSWKTQQKDGVPVGREPVHPVVGVNWEDAQAFCQWLTEKESAAGKLPKGWKYRLPTDEEWSWAAGLPQEPGATPAEKSGKNSADFPWGKDWPPTKKVGNYADEAFHAKFPTQESGNKDEPEAGKDPTAKNWIEGYEDGYATTSPVGSFPANAYGLYDMGGNVWQWCEDWFDKDKMDRVLRGASWRYVGRNHLLSSHRAHRAPGARDYYYPGFRCVLAPAGSSPLALAALSSHALQTIDLLALIDPVRDRVDSKGFNGANVWEKAGGVLSYKTDGKAGKIAPPVGLNASAYEIEVSFRRKTIGDRFHMDLPISDKQIVPLEIARGGIGFNLGGKAIGTSPALATALSGRVIARVQPDAGAASKVAVLLDGTQVATWTGDLASLAKNANEPHPDFPGQPVTSLWCAKDSYDFTTWQLRIYQGEAKVLRGASPGASAATPNTATKDAPFVNTLGMKFIPVPGTQVLFSIWDTRVMDYGAYAKAQEAAGKKVDGSWKTQQKDGVPVGREPVHPVVGVSWEDAQGFCQWLTEKESAEGKLPKGWKYRLPSDEEWSWAVGLPPEVGATPAEKSQKNTMDFPWGKDWPPTKKVGNYADESFHAKFPKNTADKKKDQPWIVGYDDGYATTSPVGSFPANAYGLYDMGGNVWQWCEDWKDATQKGHVLRGASWDNDDRASLLSSLRNSTARSRVEAFGFRCVLAPVGSAPSAAAASLSPSSEPWKDVLRDPAKLILFGGVARTPEGVRFTDFGSALLRPKQGPTRDGAVRMRATFGGIRPNLHARHTSAGSLYQLYATEKGIILSSYEAVTKESRAMRIFTVREPFQPGQDYELELRVVGQTFTVKLNGEVLGTAKDEAFVEGQFGVGAFDHNDLPALVKSLEVLDLDAPGGTSAKPAATRLSPSTEPWQDVLHDPAKLEITGGAERTPEGLRFTDAGRATNPSPGPRHGGAMRMLATFGGMRPEVFALATNYSYRLVATADGKTFRLKRYDNLAKTESIWGDFPLHEPLKPGQDYELELRMVGQTLTAKLNGEIIGKATGESSGHLEFVVGVVDNEGTPTLIHALEVLDLDVPVGTSAKPAATRLSPSTEPWQDVLRDPAKLVLNAKVERSPEGLRFPNGSRADIRSSQGVHRDGGLRILANFGGKHAQLHARHTTGAGSYRLSVDAGSDRLIILGRFDTATNRYVTLKAFDMGKPLQAGKDYELELRVVGQTLTVKLNGEILFTSTDGTLPEGGFCVDTTGIKGSPELVKAIEFLDLDTSVGASVTPTVPAATKENPFVNTLGMKFVPVPIVSGPSAGQRVLFGVWDVRVQDYAAYAGAKKVDDSWTKQARDGVPVGRELNHPVVGVNWEDAQGFCQWLTEKESTEGKLPKGWKYRLPSDEEWSWAVGLPAELGATPMEKSGKNSVDFPWGKDWPPTKKVGNYGDESFHVKFPKDANDKTKDQRWIVGYDDGYATTSPVGSFPPNAYGLYDMGGNVWQWCEDWYDKDQKKRALRGGSWAGSGRDFNLSSSRQNVAPGVRVSSHGLRCVLAPDSATPAAAPPKP